MDNVRCQSLFFISLPELRKHCTVKVTVNSHLTATEIRTAQRKMCRQLLLLHQDILSSPVPGTLNQISVIMTMEMPERVVPAVFQTCLSYTLIAKLAPEWNQAGHLLIQGIYLAAMDINVSETQICISVEVYKIQLLPPKLDDFNISENILKKFHSDNNTNIQRFSILSNWCYVLPSMKMGQITNISHKIPSDSPFQCYGDLQLHWENLYGYILPEDPQPYCSIYFKPIGEHLFTYPLNNCISDWVIQFFPKVDLEAVLNTYITDVKTIISHTCGFPLAMTSKALYATKDLIRSSLQNVNSKPANLSVKTKEKATLLQETSNKYVSSPSTCTLQNSHKMELKSNQLKFSTFTDSSVVAKDRTAGAKEKDYSRKQWETPKEPPQMNCNETFKISENSLKREPNRIIPIFKGKLLQMDRKTAKVLPERKNLTILQKLIKADKTAKLGVLKSSADQINKLLADTSLQNTRNRSALKKQSGKNKVKSTELGLKEKNKDDEHLSNYALVNEEVLGSNSKKTSHQGLDSSLIHTNHLSMHPASTACQHGNKPPNTITHKTTLSTRSKKTHLSTFCLYMDEGNPRTFQNQNPPEEAKIKGYKSRSTAQRRTKKGSKKEPPSSLSKETIKISSHQLLFTSKCSR
uniref:Chromosome 18 open reading frame 63 n=1 Tax=Salvator merianae TaxID=96440 RepID=A0A8D0BEV0_SALMN